MKKVLITGKNSFIGKAIQDYLLCNNENYIVDTISLRDDLWKNIDFSAYDVVFHAAGIAHADNGKIDEEREKLYYKVNRDLTIAVAKKAKKSGIKHFIFVSSMSVYGISNLNGTFSRITYNIKPNPTSCYGKSKLEAEEGILELQDDYFKVAIIRPPLTYGKGCKGNYIILRKLALHFSVFPLIRNERSILYIGNLAEFVRLIIQNGDSGIFFPQNKEYTSTSNLVSLISKAHNKRTIYIKGVVWLLRMMSHMTSLVNKAFGNFAYEQNMSEYKEEYRLYSLEESIALTEE